MSEDIRWGKSELVPVESGVELDKRTYLPGVVIKSKCPKCGKESERDYSEDYLSYPKTDVTKELTFYCEENIDVDEDVESCSTEWVGARITVRLAADIQYPE